MNKNSAIAMLGAGSFGTAMAIHLASQGRKVYLWGQDAGAIADMAISRSNPRYLPGFHFPDSLIPEPKLENCLANADIPVLAVPSHAFASLLQRLPDGLTNLAWLTKGLDPSTHQCLSVLVQARFGSQFPFAAIAGPSFAKEVASGLPTALNIAGNRQAYLRLLQHCFHQQQLRVYLTKDYIGVQLAGALKNVLAIACGISDGLGYGANSRAALITRGLAELCRLGKAMKAKPATFLDLAGVGDIVLTCTDNQSRNRRFGLLLAEGLDRLSAEAKIAQVVEGRHNAAELCFLAEKLGVELPICQAVHALLQAKMSASEVVQTLMERPAKVR